MTIPLVQGRTAGVATYKFAQTSSRPASFRSPFQDSEAVYIKFSQQARTQDATQSEESLQPQRIRGSVDSIFDSLGRVASKLKSIESSLEDTLLSEDQRIAFTKERDSLTEEFDRIRNSSQFKSVLETLTLIQSSLANGTSPQDLQATLGSNLSQLGSGIVGLVSYGDTNGLSGVRSVFDMITSTEALTKENAGGILSGIVAAQSLLTGDIKQKNVATTKIESGATQSFIPPELQEMQFVSGESYALSLKGYSGKGLLAAAASGINLDEQDISVLTLSIPKPDDELESEQERQQEIDSLAYKPY